MRYEALSETLRLIVRRDFEVLQNCEKRFQREMKDGIPSDGRNSQ
jgi:hypothetical protein